MQFDSFERTIIPAEKNKVILEAVEQWWSSGSWSNYFSYFEHSSPHGLSENCDLFILIMICDLFENYDSGKYIGNWKMDID